jgi:hypothetical protein
VLQVDIGQADTLMISCVQTTEDFGVGVDTNEDLQEITLNGVASDGSIIVVDDQETTIDMDPTDGTIITQSLVQ